MSRRRRIAMLVFAATPAPDSLPPKDGIGVPAGAFLSAEYVEKQ
jgi:hypothetical protein